jgi:hypothetical protein
MIEIMAGLLAGLLFLGPLGWRVWMDARRARADTIGAGVRAAINRRLRGESLLSVSVTPRLFRRRGRIVLSVPGSHEWLVEAAWPALSGHIPAGYDLVLRSGASGYGRAAAEPAAVSELRRAA